MSPGWLHIEDGSGESGARRVALRPGLTRVGSGDADVALGGVGVDDADELHVWDDPPRVVFVGDGLRPTKNGAAFEETPLERGDEIRWGTARIRFEIGGESRARLEEIEPRGTTVASSASAGPSTDHERVAWQRLHAGLLVDLGVADRATVRKWQKAVREGSFDAGECAREIEAGSTGVPDPGRLAGRAGQMLRDFVMVSAQRGVQGTGRRARQAARSGAAFLIAQGTALLVFGLILLAAALLLRLRGTSIDGLLDKLLPG